MRVSSPIVLYYFCRIYTDAQKGENQNSFRYGKCIGYKNYIYT